MINSVEKKPVGLVPTGLDETYYGIRSKSNFAPRAGNQLFLGHAGCHLD